jgi:hypothetical protein
VHTILENIGYGVFLALADVCPALEHQQFILYACGFNHAAVLGNVSKEYGQTTLLRVRILRGTNTTALAV